jgi:DNA-directed RNA polymerase specialized sigma24 family protein
LIPSESPVSLLLQEIQAGRRQAAESLWRLYFPLLVRSARKHLQRLRRGAADEEDIALGAFDSFVRGAEQGRFPRLHDRDNLWDLLTTITARHAASLYARETRQKRGGGQVRGDSVLGSPGAGADWDRLPGDSLDPALEVAVAVAMADACQRLLGCLPSDELRHIAVWKMEGRTNEEIALQLGCVRETVEHSLRLIRATWRSAAKQGPET